VPKVVFEKVSVTDPLLCYFPAIAIVEFQNKHFARFHANGQVMEIDIQFIIGADIISRGSGGHGCVSSNAQGKSAAIKIIRVDQSVGPASGKIAEAVLEVFKENLSNGRRAGTGTW
jgi:hypothetical protein